METKANYVAVGIFTLVAILAGFGFLYWSAGFNGGATTVPLRVVIPGSAAGLSRGSAVLFNGVKVGDVTRLYIGEDGNAIADTQIDRSTPITEETRADIGLAGLTGQANIELSGGDPSKPSLLERAAEEDRIAEITANPSAVTNLLQTAQTLLTRADNVLGELEGFVTEVRGPLGDTLENVREFSGALGRNADGVDRFLASVADLSESLSTVSAQLDGTLKSAGELLDAVDRDKVATIVGDAESFMRNARTASEQLDDIMGGVGRAVDRIEALSGDAAETIARVEGLLDGVEPGSIGRSIKNIENISQNTRTVVDDVSKLSSRLAARSEDFDRIITDVQQLSERLNQATVRIDSIMANVDSAVVEVERFSRSAADTVTKVDKVVEAIEPESVREAISNIASASETARSVAQDVAKVTERFGTRADDIDQIITDVRQLADRLNQASVRVDGVLAKVDNLLGSGEAEGLMTEAAETLQAFRQVADTLNQRMGTITAGLARFSDQGLREVEALVRDSRRSINRIEQAITELERNPQRLLTGGEGAVPRVDGRMRR
jgi:phospholipid/cholesterol/gamma-HCH transport system substrate-binding protein